MKTFATLATAGTFRGTGAGDVLVGRLVANSELMRALFRHSGFERFLLFCGERGDAQAAREQFADQGLVDPARLALPNLLELPAMLGRGEIDVLHYASHQDAFLDLVWLRDRYAQGPLPVTAQIHSLSYPRSQLVALRSLLLRPGAQDAIFCSSEAGRSALEASFASAYEAIGASLGIAPAPLACELPLVPLGVDVDRVRGGEREKTRALLRLPPDAFVVLSMGRFSEYDKMDLFPLLQAFAGALARVEERRRLTLLLAGARQGTQTPEMVALWARGLGISDRVLIQVDFAEERKKDLLAASDLFVSASDNPQETFGLSVVEAMAAGLPVVVSDLDGYKETVTSEVGVKVPTRWNADLSFLHDLSPILYERPLHLFLGQAMEVDLSALESAIATLYEDEPRRAAMARAAALRGQSYDWSRVIPRYEEVWRRLAARRIAPQRPRGLHPLGMDFARVFAHFPSEAFAAERTLEPTALAASLGAGGTNAYPIFPELQNLLTDGEALEALALARPGIASGALVDALRERHPDRPAWRAQYAVAWLVKHGLLR